MTRPLRSLEQFGFVHVTNQGVDHYDMFSDDRDREHFESLVATAAIKFGIEVHAICLMSTHFHLILNCPAGNLSEFMREVELAYSIQHNQRVGRVGSLYTSRFRSFAIGTEDEDPDANFKLAQRYVHRNPLDFVPLWSLAAYRFSSYGVYLGRRAAPEWLITDLTLDMFGHDPRRLRVFTEEPRLADKSPADGRVIVPFTLDEILLAVAEGTGTTVAQLCTPSQRERGDARGLAALLARQFRTAPATYLAEVFGFDSQHGVRQMANRTKDRIALDPLLVALHGRAVARLWENFRRSVEAA